MKPLYEQATTWETLRKGVEKGYWTLADLDIPPPGFMGDPAKYQNLLRPRVEPGVELDGVTTYTNDNPIPPELPF